MKYHFLRDRHMSCGYMVVLMLPFPVWLTIAEFSKLDLSLIILVWALFALTAAVGIYETQLGLKMRSYAVIRPDGVHIMLRMGGELAKIQWEDVIDCKYLPFSGHASYMMLITGWEARIYGKPASAFCSGVSEKEAKHHRLDEAAEALARGEISAEEFKNRPLFLIAVSKKDYIQCRNMWKKTKKTD